MNDLMCHDLGMNTLSTFLDMGLECQHLAWCQKPHSCMVLLPKMLWFLWRKCRSTVYIGVKEPSKIQLEINYCGCFWTEISEEYWRFTTYNQEKICWNSCLQKCIVPAPSTPCSAYVPGLEDILSECWNFLCIRHGQILHTQKKLMSKSNY